MYNLTIMPLQAEAMAGGGNLQFIIMMAIIFGIMYIFMIRPQQKRQKELAKFRNSLEKGAKVITAGGIYGTIKSVTEYDVQLEVDNGVCIRVDKSMIMKDSADIAQANK